VRVYAGKTGEKHGKHFNRYRTHQRIHVSRHPMFDTELALKIDLTQESAEIQNLRNRLKVHLEKLLDKEVDDVVTVCCAFACCSLAASS
jgi:hypothetical protein